MPASPNPAGAAHPAFYRRLAVACAVGVLSSALAFFISLFLGIVVLFIYGAFHPVNMAIAYRYIAAPVALAALPVAVVASLRWQHAHPRGSGSSLPHSVPRT